MENKDALKATKKFARAIRLQQNESSIYAYADIEGFRYGQCYRTTNTQNAFDKFFKFYNVLYLKDLQDNA